MRRRERTPEQCWPIVVNNLGLVHSTLRRNFPWVARQGEKSEEYQEYIQNGILGLLRACQKHNPKKGKLSTYADFWIYQTMIRAYHEKGGHSGVRIPVYLYGALNKIKREFGEDMDIPKLLASRKITGRQAAAFNALAHPVPIDPAVDYVCCLSNQPAGNGDLREFLMSIIRKRLTDREADIVMKKFGLDDKGDQTLKTMSRRWAVSRERVRQIARDALLKLRPLIGELKSAL